MTLQARKQRRPRREAPHPFSSDPAVSEPPKPKARQRPSLAERWARAQAAVVASTPEAVAFNPFNPTLEPQGAFGRLVSDRLLTEEERADFEKLRRIRSEIADEIERLLDLLDRSEPDPDLEPTTGAQMRAGRGRVYLDESELDMDVEPWLGAPERHPDPFGWNGPDRASQEHWGQGSRADLEISEGDDEPDADSEPSLASLNDPSRLVVTKRNKHGLALKSVLREHDQRGWARGSMGDYEGDEHDGREPDVDDEPSLGSVDMDVDQSRWGAGLHDDREEETDSGIADREGLMEQVGRCYGGVL